MGKSSSFTLADLEKKGFVADENGVFQPNSLIEKMNDRLIIHTATNIRIKKTSRPKASIVVEKKIPEGLQAIMNILDVSGLSYDMESMFDEERKFRFDISIPKKHLAIEYEGLFSNKSRHTTKSGYVGDCRKYNLAQIRGWIVLRYTAANYKDFVEDIQNFL